jgi:O-antigen/teichoic acid export membrane protein
MKVFRTDFVRVSAWSSVSTFIKMLTSFISIKVVSSIIGPSGLALVGQFLNSITIFNVVSLGGISQGVTKYVAEYTDRPDLQKRVISTSLRIVFIATFLVSVFIVTLSKPIGLFIFKTTEHTSVIILLGVTIFLYSFNTLILSILNGFKEFKKYLKINMIVSLLGLASSVILVYILGLYGALLNCVVSQSVVMIVTFFFIRKDARITADLFRSKELDNGIVKKLAIFSIMAFSSSVFAPLSQIFIRNNVTEILSLDNAGLWEAMNRVSAMYLLFITTSISTFYLPRLAELRDNYLVKLEIFNTAKIVLPILALICISIYFLRDLVILILFSKTFTSMRDLFAAQMLGDFFKISSWLLACLFWAKARIKPFIATEIIFNLTAILFTSIFVKTWGLQGTAIAYALNYFIYLLVMIWIFKDIVFTKNRGQIT